MRILILGGAGYIGSHMVRAALNEKYDVSVIDDLSTGHKESLPKEIEFQNFSIGDRPRLLDFLTNNHFDLVMHFCAFSLVGESVSNPKKYFENNVDNTQTLLECMIETNHTQLVFSSTAAVYGNPEQAVIDENHPKNPINPYGETKWEVEKTLQSYGASNKINSVCLRYFNAAGAASSCCIGEKHEPETHLIPNILKAAASGGESQLKVFGTDYPTEDGSCVRDYIHVDDLSSAHLLAGQYLANNPGAHVFNLGNGEGFSVLEVIQAARKITGASIDFEACDRRKGDPPSLVANAEKARSILNWNPKHTDMESIIKSAWPWHLGKESFH